MHYFPMIPHTIVSFMSSKDIKIFFPLFVFEAGVFPWADTDDYFILLQYPRFWSNIQTCFISTVLTTEPIFAHYIRKFRHV